METHRWLRVCSLWQAPTRGCKSEALFWTLGSKEIPHCESMFKKKTWTAETFAARFKRPKLPVSGIRNCELQSLNSHSRVMKNNHSTKCLQFTSQFPHFKHIFGSKKKKARGWEPGEDCPSSKLPLSWKLPAKPLTNTAKVGNIGMLALGRSSLVESHEFESHEPRILNEKNETHKYTF